MMDERKIHDMNVVTKAWLDAVAPSIKTDLEAMISGLAVDLVGVEQTRDQQTEQPAVSEPSTPEVPEQPQPAAPADPVASTTPEPSVSEVPEQPQPSTPENPYDDMQQEGVDVTPTYDPADPLGLLDNITKDGKHPFFRGPLAHLHFLTRQELAPFTAGLWNQPTEFYPDKASFVDASQIEDMITQGIMQDYVRDVIDTFIAPPGEPEPNSESVINFLSSEQGKAVVQRMISVIPDGDGSELFRFMVRYGYTEQALAAFKKIAEGYVRQAQANAAATAGGA